MMATRKLLAYALAIPLFAACVFVAWVAFNLAAPCEYHNDALMSEARIVVEAVRAEYVRSGVLPSGSASDISVPGVPDNLHWASEPLPGKAFAVSHFGSDRTGAGFDGPWVRYDSSRDNYECHSR